MCFVRLYIKQITLIYFHTVSGPFTTRKWATFHAKPAHFLVVSHRFLGSHVPYSYQHEELYL